ncbi:MAG: hypothetical protein FJZ01_20035 [Candidatus Sericytochromatia bacterium]|nr:hypothetical protein [Candidatus Tanganyikabacteria bacterium]
MHVFRFVVALLVALWLIVPAAPPAQASGKPVLAVRQATSASNANRMLWDRLRTAARNRLTRFQVVEGAAPGADIEVTVEFQLEPTVEINRKARTEEYERKDASGKTVKDTRIVETVEYTCNGEADVRILDRRTGLEDMLHVVRTGVSHSSTGDAREEVYSGIVRFVLDALRSRYRLQATVTHKDGRNVFLDRGRDVGIEPDAVFSALSPDGSVVGEVRVERVESGSAVGRVRVGYYKIGPGTRLEERIGGGAPVGLSIGLVNRLLPGTAQPIGQSYLGLEGHLRQADTDAWFDVAGDLTFISNTSGVNGLGLFASFIPQVELLPEWLWLHMPFGAGFEVYSTTAASGKSATATGLHLTVGLGTTLATPVGLRLSADAGVMTPWTVSGWTEGSGRNAVAATGPTFDVGGPFVRWSLTYGF